LRTAKQPQQPAGIEAVLVVHRADKFEHIGAAAESGLASRCGGYERRKEKDRGQQPGAAPTRAGARIAMWSRHIVQLVPTFNPEMD
jgi:hypothetical protein